MRAHAGAAARYLNFLEVGIDYFSGSSVLKEQHCCMSVEGLSQYSHEKFQYFAILLFRWIICRQKLQLRRSYQPFISPPERVS